MFKRYLLLFTLCLLVVAGRAIAQSTGSQSQSPGSPNQTKPSNPAPAAPATPSKAKKASQQLYGLGDQMFLINGGLYIPLFFQSESGAIGATNLSLGGAGSLELQVFLNNNLTVGAELGGAFAFSPNLRTLFLVPITAKVSWIFHAYPFDFPVFLGAGVNFTSLDTQRFVGPIVKPGAAAYWNFNSKWSFGLRAVYWWVPEIYFGPVPDKTRSRFGNFLQLSLSALYHF